MSNQNLQSRFIDRLESRCLLSTSSGNDSIIGRTNDALFYASAENSTGVEPMFIRSNGSTGILLKDINPGAASSNPKFVAEVGDVLYFSADDGTGPALWRTGGTIKTSKVAAVTPNTSIPAASIGNTLYFAGSASNHAHALWKTDGTPGNLIRLRDFNTDPQELAVFKINVFFVATEDQSGSSLWRTDGTNVNIVESGFASGILAQPLAVTREHLFFRDYRPDHNKSHLWSLDANFGSSLMQTTDGPDTIRDLTVRADNAYFICADSQKHRDVLFRSNGIIGQVKRLYNFDDAGMILPRDADGLARNSLYVEESNVSAKRTTLMSVSEPLGSERLAQLTRPGPEEFAEAKQTGSDLYFARIVSGGQQLWHSNGTREGTRMVKRFYNVPFLGAFTSFDVSVLFTTSDQLTTSVLWRTDRTTNATEKVRGFATGTAISLDDARLLDTRIYFTVPGLAEDTRVWFSDGTRSGTGSPDALG